MVASQFATSPAGPHAASHHAAGQWHGGASPAAYKYYHHWYAHHYHPWGAVSWTRLAAWTAVAFRPVYYNYQIVDGTVYQDGESIGSTEDVAAKAAALVLDASTSAQSAMPTGAEGLAQSDQDWLPLGVFAVMPSLDGNYEVAVQLAIDRDGHLAGTYRNLAGGVTLPITGGIDAQGQQAAWQIGETDPIVMQTGLDNLTRNASPVLIFFPDGASERWILERLREDEAIRALGEPEADE